MLDDPLVSVIIPTHNRVDYLQKCIQSILAQTYGHFELLVIDDASTDDTEEAVRNFGDARIKYKKVERSGNLPHLRNLGLKMAKGDLVASMDNDDLWMVDKLKIQISTLQKFPEARFTICNAVYTEEGRILHGDFFHKMSPEHFRIPLFLYPELLRGTWKPLVQATMFYKDCLSTIGYYDEHQYGDHYFMTKLCTHYKGILTKEKQLCVDRHPGNMTAKFQDRAYLEVIESIQYVRDQDRISQKEYHDFSYKALYSLGMKYYHDNSSEKAMALFRKAKSHKLTLKLLIRMISIKFPQIARLITLIKR